MRIPKVLFLITIEIILLVFILDCGITNEAKRKTTAFAKVTKYTSEIAENELLHMKESTIIMNKYRLNLKNPSAKDPDQSDLDEKFDPEIVNIRIRAIRALRNYSEVLYTIVNENANANLIESLENFFHELDGIEDIKYSQKEKEKLLTTVKVIGTMLEDYKKREFLKELIPKVNKEIGTLCDLLASEFDYKKSLKLGLAYQITTERLLIASDSIFVKSNNKEEKKNALEAIQFANQNKIRKSELFPLIVNSLNEIKKNHNELSKIIINDEIDLNALLQTSRELRKLNTIYGNKL